MNVERLKVVIKYCEIAGRELNMTTIQDWINEWEMTPISSLLEIRKGIAILNQKGIFIENYPEFKTYALMIDQEIAKSGSPAPK